MSGMYDALIVAHSWIRWAVLVLAVVAFARAATGRFTRRPWTPADDAAGRWLVISVDIQVLLGLVLVLLLQLVHDVGVARHGRRDGRQGDPLLGG